MVPSTDQYSHRDDCESYNNPEKWYVRFRWLQFAARRARNKGKHFIRFLTLPGVECLDVRLFHFFNLLDVTATGFEKCVAYCERNYERYARIGNILPNALRFTDSYEKFVGVGSSGFTRRADKWFPFDVINLDFSGPGFIQPGRDASETIEAILETFRLQSSKRHSFSLFLTLPADPKKDSQSGKMELARCLNTNLTDTQTQDFADIFQERYPGYQTNDLHPYRTINYSDFLLVTVPKIIIKFGLNEWFNVSCEEKMTYIGEGHTTRMVSFCFECDYIGLGRGYAENPRTDELLRYSENISNIVSRSYKDINQLFDQYPRLAQKYSRIRDEARQYFGQSII